MPICWVIRDEGGGVLLLVWSVHITVFDVILVCACVCVCVWCVYVCVCVCVCVFVLGGRGLVDDCAGLVMIRSCHSPVAIPSAHYWPVRQKTGQ